MQDIEERRGKRRRLTKNVIERQKRIAKSLGVPVKTPHKLYKMHALNCGSSTCAMCGNPRKFWGERTLQERKFMQERIDYDTDSYLE